MKAMTSPALQGRHGGGAGLTQQALAGDASGGAWTPADSEDGRDYWQALRIREWTRESHFKIHQLIGLPINDWFWNEHNFVFRRADGLFYHSRGATPGWSDYHATLVPLNMAEPPPDPRHRCRAWARLPAAGCRPARQPDRIP
jgi:hypothetical protein